MACHLYSTFSTMHCTVTQQDLLKKLSIYYWCMLPKQEWVQGVLWSVTWYPSLHYHVNIKATLPPVCNLCTPATWNSNLPICNLLVSFMFPEYIAHHHWLPLTTQVAVWKIHRPVNNQSLSLDNHFQIRGITRIKGSVDQLLPWAGLAVRSMIISLQIFIGP